MLPVACLDELFGFFRREVALVLVDIYPELEDAAVSFRMKLGRIDVVPVPDHLVGARLGGEKK